MRLVQHKKEAYYFYRFLSIFYDKYVNPLFWTERMRDEALELARLDAPDLTVADVGSGTGFTTQGIVRHVAPARVTCVDQSPHQMAKAKKKADLRGCTFHIGDAENLPLDTDHFDRYVSAGSIEYWPDPQRGIAEAYRVVKPGGIALMIGPLEPEDRLGRFFARLWMLFPREEEYRDWFGRAGFTGIQVRYVRPHWQRGRGKYGIAIAGVKPRAGDSPAAKPRPVAEAPMSIGRRLLLAGRVVLGSAAGFFFIPLALFGYLFSPGRQDDTPPQHRERLNGYQIGALIVLLGLAAGAIWLIGRVI